MWWSTYIRVTIQPVFPQMADNCSTAFPTLIFRQVCNFQECYVLSMPYFFEYFINCGQNRHWLTSFHHTYMRIFWFRYNFLHFKCTRKSKPDYSFFKDVGHVQSSSISGGDMLSNPDVLQVSKFKLRPPSAAAYASLKYFWCRSTDRGACQLSPLLLSNWLHKSCIEFKKYCLNLFALSRSLIIY